MPHTKSDMMPAEYYGIHAINPGVRNNSGSRAQMFGSHFTQKLVVKGVGTARLHTGMAERLSEFIFTIKMPCDAKILSVIERYPTNSLNDRIPANPETIVIYENVETYEISYISIPKYASYHQYFGFEYVFTSELNKVRKGGFIPKDTILAHPITYGENRAYNYTVELNVAMMSIPAGAEDGIIISRDKLEDLSFKVYDRRIVEFDKNDVPLNLYGTVEDYRPFPEIGQCIHENGILMATRKLSECGSPVETSIYDLMEVDHNFDSCVYVRGPKGKVVDIAVIQNPAIVNGLPPKMMESLGKYPRSLTHFYRELTEFKRKMDSDPKYRDVGAFFSPKLQRLLVKAGILSGTRTLKTSLIHKKNPISQYRVEFVIEYEMIPTIGFKLTGLNADKGVICHIEEPENMPVDMFGRRADVVMAEDAIVNRLIVGKPYEHFLSDACVNVERNLTRITGVSHGSARQVNKALRALTPEVVNEAIQYLLRFYSVIDTNYHDMMISRMLTEEDSYENRIEHLSRIFYDKLTIPTIVTNPISMKDMVSNIQREFPPPIGPVSYIGNSGRRVTTKNNIRIAPMAFMVLEKIADDGSAVSSAALHHFNVLTPETKSSMHKHPYSASPTKSSGESETRLWLSYCGRRATAEIMDRNNNPVTHQLIYHQFLTADQPTNISCLIDRDVHRYGDTKPLQLLNHLATVTGWKPKYVPEQR